MKPQEIGLFHPVIIFFHHLYHFVCFNLNKNK